MGGFCRAVGNRLRAIGVKTWSRRTTVMGYLGVIGGSVEMAILGGQHVGLVILGASVAAIGHYNELQLRKAPES